MATEILLPKIGRSMNEGEVAEWPATDGDTVTAGQPLFLLKADKSANEAKRPPAVRCGSPPSRARPMGSAPSSARSNTPDSARHAAQ